MVKNTNTTAPDMTTGATLQEMAPIVVSIPHGTTATAHGLSLPVVKMPTSTIVYLLLNGFSQSMTDAGTSGAARARELAVKTANEHRGKGNELSKAQEAAFLAQDNIKTIIEAAAIDARQKRMAALMEGTMVYGTRGPNGPRKSPLEAFLYACADADAKASARKQGKTLPKGDAYEALLEGIIAKRRADYTARFEATNADGAIDDLI